jgi:hypothetical protein
MANYRDRKMTPQPDFFVDANSSVRHPDARAKAAMTIHRGVGLLFFGLAAASCGGQAVVIGDAGTSASAMDDAGSGAPTYPAADSSACHDTTGCILCDDQQFHCGSLVLPQCDLAASQCVDCVFCGDSGQGYRTACPGTGVVTTKCAF